MSSKEVWLEAQNVDVIHSHGRSSFSFLAFLKELGMVRRPLVMHDHFGKVEQDGSVPPWFRLWARRHVAHYVGVCTAMDTWARRAGIPAGRRGVIPCTLDLRRRPRISRAGASDNRKKAAAAPDPRAEFAVPEGTAVGVCLGGVRPQKGIDTLLAAVALCRRRGAFRIVVAGGVRDQNYWDHCLRETRRLGLEDEIVFAGERSGIPAWLGGFDFAVHAARYESGPLVVIEHVAAGLPLVCTRTGEIARRAEMLGVEGFVPPEDPPALAAAIDALVGATPRQRVARARRGTQLAYRHFDIRAVMPAWREVYEKVSGKPFVTPNTAAAA
jgi:glycosyltransferase involved in cell wall biosynthesis